MSLALLRFTRKKKKDFVRFTQSCFFLGLHTWPRLTVALLEPSWPASMQDQLDRDDVRLLIEDKMQNWIGRENEECNGVLTFTLQQWSNEESNNRGSPEESSELASGDMRRRKF
jgi:hypothetical protein